nr:hypothetical protein [Tanacetum cinerariifolium]
MLTVPIHGEVLIMYLTALTESIGAALFLRRGEGHVPIYFVSRVLQGAELNYPALEKLILALVHALRRLRRYFQEHMVVVLTDSSIKQALAKPEKGNNNKETPKDFLIEAPPEDNGKEVRRKADTKLEEAKPSCKWKLYTDEASSSDGSGAGLMLIDLEAMQPTIREYLQRTKEILRIFRSYTIEYVRRNQNKKADALSKLASMTFKHLTKEVLVEVFVRRSMEEKEVLKVETKEEKS